MEMPNEEIIRRYKQAKHKPSQIQILADLNACPKSKILEIISGEILDNHAAACATVPQEPLKKVEVVNSPLGEIDALESFVTDRMDELENQIKELESKYRDLATTLLVIGQYKEMATWVEDFIARMS